MHVTLYTNHQRLKYEDSHWVIYDGDGIKESTNGTWIYIEDAYEITDGMMFKAGQTMFKVNVIDPSVTS